MEDELTTAHICAGAYYGARIYSIMQRTFICNKSQSFVHTHTHTHKRASWLSNINLAHGRASRKSKCSPDCTPTVHAAIEAVCSSFTIWGVQLSGYFYGIIVFMTRAQHIHALYECVRYKYVCMRVYNCKIDFEFSRSELLGIAGLLSLSWK